ncbi:hypothetical protein HU200_050053 [Digitaria exilis]|uniref:Reverse transcriptase/retrotransposon-derived protein RNase H-like domain-containing protein n=1 Tax=Digitaria exilis TaxID=1010633 RepID=A0A835AU43_9POAL|nr:hypothetical protein HU200_050053 [Digitaria exilis]
MDLDKIQAVHDWPLPCSIKALRGFLGLTGYYRRFIHNYGVIAAPLTALLKRDAFQWGEPASAAFLALKTVLTTAPVLQLPDFAQPFVVDCDASGSGFGAVLHQGQGPIAFFSRTVAPQHAKLAAYERIQIQVDHILERHSGIGVKKLKIQVHSGAKYNFPRSVLLNGSGDSIQYLHLTNCSFRPTVTFGGLRSLTRLHLCIVRITGDELGCLLSHSLALEKLELKSCNLIVYLKVPHLLQRLDYLLVYSCARLKVTDNEAPNISNFTIGGNSTVQLSLGETLQMKNLTMHRCGSVLYARAELPSSMPNLEALTVHSQTERAYAPMLCSKFLRLRHLSIGLTGGPFYPAYHYLSLASFFDAAPSLETFNLDNVSIFADPTDLRQMLELQHHNLRMVRITGFSSAKSLIELTCHVLKSCTDRDNKSGKYSPLERDILMEGHKAVMAIRRYIEPRVPSTVKLHVLEPCSCHSV